MTTPEAFVGYFQARHRWWCKPGSAIYKDLTAFALEQADSPDSADDLYLIFCTLHGIKPKPEIPETD
jgi:hypothetical protein